jgi:hypothetical protein
VAPRKTAPGLLLRQEHVKREMRIAPGKHYRGYQGLGDNVTRYEGGFQRDWHEAIDLYREQDPAAVAVRP